MSIIIILLQSDHFRLFKVTLHPQTVRTIRDREPRTSTTTFSQLLSSDHEPQLLNRVESQSWIKPMSISSPAECFTLPLLSWNAHSYWIQSLPWLYIYKWWPHFSSPRFGPIFLLDYSPGSTVSIYQLLCAAIATLSMGPCSITSPKLYTLLYISRHKLALQLQAGDQELLEPQGEGKAPHR